MRCEHEALFQVDQAISSVLARALEKVMPRTSLKWSMQSVSFGLRLVEPVCMAHIMSLLRVTCTVFRYIQRNSLKES